MTDGIKRRDFLKVLGVTGAGATITGCSEPERLLPYVVAPEEITPGVATWYTTVCDGFDIFLDGRYWTPSATRRTGGDRPRVAPRQKLGR